MLVDAGDGRQGLLVSGTASIVGHQSVHEGDVGAQTGETLENLHAVLAQAARLAGPGTRFDPTTMQSTVYLRRPGDAAAVRTVLAQAWGATSPAVAQAVFVRADICRRELLVEIEGHLWPGAA
jgi:enamine deaminase RidA (YjgF/YER057c/UK114 family)